MCLWSRNRNYDHFFLHCILSQSTRQSLLININKIDESILKMHDEIIAKALLHNKFDLSSSKSKISSAIKLIVSSERFSNLLI